MKFCFNKLRTDFLKHRGTLFHTLAPVSLVDSYSLSLSVSLVLKKTIYRNVLDDVYEYPVLEKDLKEFQKLLGMHRRQ